VVVSAVADVVRQKLLSRLMMPLRDEDRYKIQPGDFVVRRRLSSQPL